MSGSTAPQAVYEIYQWMQRHRCGRYCWNALNQLVDLIGRSVGDQSTTPILHPPIFILGAPRSGSTLLYQRMIDAFGFGYLSNLHCALWGAPHRITESLATPRLERRPDYNSRFGATEGWDGPSECGDFWYRFFSRRPHYVSAGALGEVQRAWLRESVARLLATSSEPFLFKNLYCSLRLAPLREALPEALFVVVRRALADNAKSILAVRQAMYGNFRHWWSMEPPGIGLLRGLAVHEQVVEQVVGVNHAIDEERKRFDGERFFDVSYEELCADPYASLKGIERFLRNFSLDCRMQEVASAVSSSGASFARNLPVELAEAIDRYAVSRYGEQS